MIEYILQQILTNQFLTTGLLLICFMSVVITTIIVITVFLYGLHYFNDNSWKKKYEGVVIDVCLLTEVVEEVMTEEGCFTPEVSVVCYTVRNTAKYRSFVDKLTLLDELEIERLEFKEKRNEHSGNESETGQV